MSSYHAFLGIVSGLFLIAGGWLIKFGLSERRRGLESGSAPGPVLANYGLDNLRFLKPVSPGDDIRVRLTVKQKQAARKPEYGEVRWNVEVFNQDSDNVARYELLTMNARGDGSAN